MSVNRNVLILILSLTSLAVPAIAQVSPQQPADSATYGMTAGRLIASSGAVLALIGVIVGVLGFFRRGRLLGIVALVAGLIGTGIGGVTLATAGGFGTGGGRAGGIVGLVLGLIAMAFGGLSLSRSGATG